MYSNPKYFAKADKVLCYFTDEPLTEALTEKHAAEKNSRFTVLNYLLMSSVTKLSKPEATNKAVATPLQIKKLLHYSGTVFVQYILLAL